jgi:hypothetical protein
MSSFIAYEIKEDAVGMACDTHGRGEGRKVYRMFVGKSEGERPLRRPRRRWEDGIRMGLRQIGCGVRGVDSTGSGQTDGELW